MAGSRETPESRRRRDQATVAPPADEPAAVGTLWIPRSVEERPEVVIPEVMEVVDPEPKRSYGRRPAAGEVRTVVASAARIQVDDRKAIAATRRRRQAWQSEALDYAYEIPEVGGVLDFKANLLSKMRLFSAIRPDPHGPPVAVDDEESGVSPDEAKIAMATLERLRNSQGGQSTIVGDIAFHFEAVGEAYLHGHEDPDTGEEDWNIRSVDELAVQGDTFGLRGFAGSNQIERIPVGDIVVRLWMRDRRFSGLAISPMRRVLSSCENLMLLDREVRATSSSRLHNGYMLWPQGMSFGSVDPTRDSGGGEGADDGFLADIEEATYTAIQDPGSAAAFAPINVQGPDDKLEKVRHVTISRQLDGVLDQRLDAQVLRVARGMNMPVETVIGLAETKFANAAVMKKSEWDAYGEPMAIAIVDAITAGYYQWMLEEAGIPRERAAQHFVWFDPSDALAAPDPVDNADHGLEQMVISPEAWRRVKGFTEADGPSEDEVMLMMVAKMTRQDPTVAAQMLRDSGVAPNLLIPAPMNGILNTDDMSISGLPPDKAAAITTPVAAALVAAARPRTKGAELGARLATIDRDLRTRVRTAAELALRRALERAGNKVKSAARRNVEVAAAAKGVRAALVAADVGKAVVNALGLTDEGLVEGAFGELATDFGAWVDVAYGQALGELEKAVGPLDAAVRTQLMQNAQRSGESASSWLADAMTKLAAARLYNPDTLPAAVGEAAEVSGAVPEWIIRAAVGIAGGDTPNGGDGEPLTSADGGAVMGVATGPLALSTVDGVEAYQWDYGSAPRIPFPPHEDLDGVIGQPEDFVNDDGWPSDLAWPGDHDGCLIASTVVAGPGAVHATRRWYEGDTVTLTLVTGQMLTCTPNHPILTAAGWIPAGEIIAHTDVIACGDAKHVAVMVDPDFHQIPAPIAEVFDSYPEHRERTRRTAPAAFHGDGTGSASHAVRTDRRLRRRCDDGTAVSPWPPANALERVAPLVPRAWWSVRTDMTSVIVGDLANELRPIRVESVSRAPFAGPVYNLDTCAGWFVASGVFVGNCVCDVTPLLLLPSESEGEDA